MVKPWCWMTCTPYPRYVLGRRWNEARGRKDVMWNDGTRRGIRKLTSAMHEYDDDDIPTHGQTSEDVDGSDDPLEPPAKTIEELVQGFEKVAGKQSKDQLEGFLKTWYNETEHTYAPGRCCLLLPAPVDREERKRIHQFFRTHSDPFHLVTDTVDDEHNRTRKMIRVYPHHKGKEEDQGRRPIGPKKRKRGEEIQFDYRNNIGHADRNNFLLFILYKENKDTQDALNVLGRMLRCKPSSFGFAGTKDKRGVTTQQVTLYRQKAESLAKLNKVLRGIMVGNFRYVEEPLKLGDLLGNRFCIVLRGIVESEAVLKQGIENLEKHGFINYFGLQRFSGGTHHVGKALLKGQWMDAIKLIVRPKEKERQESAEAKQYFLDTLDAKGALEKMPHFLVAERAMLEGFLKHGEKNLVHVLSCIPRTLQMLYVHSYQSYLWNRVATARLEIYGSSTVVEGDLVCRRGGVASSKADVDPDQVCVATVEDVQDGRYNVFDLVLPLPGKRVIYPSNETGLLFHKLAEEDGISLEDSPHKVKMFSITSLTGAYRRIIQKPQDVTWKVLQYSNEDEDLTETDADKLRGRCMKTSGGGDRRALQIEFTLPASCYATMAVRELTKASSSAAFQKSMALTTGNETANALA